jgi:hypothetical protein
MDRSAPAAAGAAQRGSRGLLEPDGAGDAGGRGGLHPAVDGPQRVDRGGDG